jgi:hypothetical protein
VAIEAAGEGTKGLGEWPLVLCGFVWKASKKVLKAKLRLQTLAWPILSLAKSN